MDNLIKYSNGSFNILARANEFKNKKSLRIPRSCRYIVIDYFWSTSRPQGNAGTTSFWVHQWSGTPPTEDIGLVNFSLDTGFNWNDIVPGHILSKRTVTISASQSEDKSYIVYDGLDNDYYYYSMNNPSSDDHIHILGCISNM